MEWLVFALLAYLFWTVCNIISKVILTKHVKSVFVYAIFIGFVSLLPLFLIPFKSLTIPNTQLLTITLITGMLYIYALIPYFKALSMKKFQELPRYGDSNLYLCYFLLLSFYEIVAFFLLFFGGFLISLRTKESFKISRAF